MSMKRIAAIIIGLIVGLPIYLPILLFLVFMAGIVVVVLVPLMLVEYAITGKVKWTDKVGQ